MRGTHPVEKRERSLPIGDGTGGKNSLSASILSDSGRFFCDFTTAQISHHYGKRALPKLASIFPPTCAFDLRLIMLEKR